MYERAAGDKTLPSDLRPPYILKVRIYEYLLWILIHEAIENSGLPFPRPPRKRRI